MKKIALLYLFAIFVLAGCLGPTVRGPESILPPWDQAQVYGMKAGAIVKAAYDRAQVVEQSGNLEEIAFYRSKVNPVINLGKRIVADYLGLTARWEVMATAGTDYSRPADLLKLEVEIEALLLDLVDLIGPYLKH